jgi:outer membrane lipoprotein-sorting protein
MAGNDPNPVKNLRPKHVLDALFVDVLAYKNDPKVVSTLKETIEGQRSYYILEFVNTGTEDSGDILEEIWVDRTDMEVSRKIVYGKNGKVESRIEFEKYQMADGIAFPQVIQLQRPIEHYALKMTFQKNTFNQSLPNTAFLLERPNGAKDVEIAPAALTP